MNVKVAWSAYPLASVISVILLTVLGVCVAYAGGLQALGTAVVASALASGIGAAYFKRKRARNQELWDWWDGRVSES